MKEIEERTNLAIRNVGAWLNEAGLTLPAHKMKAVLISGKRIMKKMEVIVRGTEIESKSTVK